ncbi:MAG TPA: LacI family DNA-binding transcriptional regulator [Baekduia sp.]
MGEETAPNGGARGRAASIKDVAQRAGVSVGTVSNVLNRPDRVSRATLDRVREAIDALGFVRNEPARQLKAGASRTIAYVVIDAGNPFFTDVASGIEDVAEEEGLGLYICNAREDPDREARYLDLLGEQRVHGVLLTSVSSDRDHLQRLAQRGIPVVLVDRSGDDAEFCSVSVDDVLGGDLAVTHLLERGHDRIAYVGGPSSIPQIRDRLRGAERALERAGRPDARLTVIETPALNVAGGRGAGARLLGVPADRRPTAAFCANDLVALGLLQEATQHGLQVPGDLAIVGYDDIIYAEAATVPLTSVRQPRELLGQTAARLLIEEASGTAGPVRKQVRFDPELIVRASSGPPGRA